MDTNDDKADEYKVYRRSKDEEAKVLDRFRDPAPGPLLPAPTAALHHPAALCMWKTGVLLPHLRICRGGIISTFPVSVNSG